MCEVGTPCSEWNAPQRFSRHVGSSVETTTKVVADEADIIVLVFGAHWCPPSRRFFGFLRDAMAVMKDGVKLPLPSLAAAVADAAKQPTKVRSKAAMAAKEREEAERAAALQSEEDLVLEKRSIEAILISHDRDEEGYQRAVASFPGLVLAFKDVLGADMFTRLAPPGLPYVMIVDTQKREIISTDVAGMIEKVR